MQVQKLRLNDNKLVIICSLNSIASQYVKQKLSESKNTILVLFKQQVNSLPRKEKSEVLSLTFQVTKNYYVIESEPKKSPKLSFLFSPCLSDRLFVYRCLSIYLFGFVSEIFPFVFVQHASAKFCMPISEFAGQTIVIEK